MDHAACIQWLEAVSISVGVGRDAGGLPPASDNAAASESSPRRLCRQRTDRWMSEPALRHATAVLSYTFPHAIDRRVIALGCTFSALASWGRFPN